MKQHIKRVLKQMGIEVRRSGFRRDLFDFLTDRRIDLVLDVGANVGQFAGTLRANGYRGEIISFEPVQAVYRQLADRAASDARWQVRNHALGAVPGPATIHVADASVFSSMLPSTASASAFESAAATRTETIDVRTLDAEFPEIAGNVLLKIDTQGFERQVLEGARRSLARLKGVLMELPLVHLYQGTWRFHEAIAFMEEAGFVPAQFDPVNYHPADPVSLVEVDCLFRRRDDGSE